jgi:hypothetical protein
VTLLVPEFWTRDSSYRRKNRIDVFQKATLILRDLTPGSWLIEGIPYLLRSQWTGLQFVNPVFADLEAGGGIIAWYGTGANRAVIMSGRLEQLTETEEVLDGGGLAISKSVGGSSDLAVVTDKLGHPHPADLDFSAAAIKTYNTVGETAVKALVNDNMGSSANASRKLANFATAADLGRGTAIKDDVRLDGVGDLVAGWCIRAGLLPRVLPVSGVLTFDVYVGTDRTHTVVFATSRQNATRITRQVKAPDLTFEWVGGSGVGAARTFRSAEDTTTEGLWGFRREGFKDRRDSSDTTVLDQQASTDLAAKAGQTVVAVEPIDGLPNLRYGVDYMLGDIVTVRTRSGISTAKAIREVKIECSPDVITRFAPAVSDPLTPGVDDLFVFNRVRNLEVDTYEAQAAT